MAQLKVIVNRLNKRKEPITDFSDKGNIVGSVSKGYIFEGDNILSNTLGDWYVDRDGYYYWGGGLSVISFDNSALSFSPQKAEQGKVSIPLPKSPPKDLPLNKTQCLEMAAWMDNNFGDKCAAAVEDTPFTKQLLYAIVCKETAIYVHQWINDHSPEEILGRCVFDASGMLTELAALFLKTPRRLLQNIARHWLMNSLKKRIRPGR
jgi:hypothetical protein